MTLNQEQVEMNKKIEAEELTEEQVAALTPADPLESEEVQMAAGQFANMVKQIKARAKNMKAGGLGRVVAAYCEFPFAPAYPKFRSQAEQDLFLLLVSNDKAKKVISEAIKDQEQTLQQSAVNQVTNDILTAATAKVKNKGENDGMA